ncbi:MAG: hypothetical protein QM808_11155 [Steroidobacteraceae bacterium]
MRLQTQADRSAVEAVTNWQAQARLELFAMYFARWRLAIGSAMATGLVIGGVFFYLTRDPLLWYWTGLQVGSYLLQALACWRFERHPPAQDSAAARIWEWVWISLTGISGLLSAGLMWFLPGDNLALQFSAAVVAATFAIGEVSASGHRSLIYAAVISQASMVCAALLLHVHLPFGAFACVMFSLLLLYFGLQLNQSMLGEIEQRLRAGQLAREIEAGQQRLLEVQHQQSVLHERQRVMQDMHDGLGSSLSSSLVLLERGELSVPDAAKVMRECIDDLRMIIEFAGAYRTRSADFVRHAALSLAASYSERRRHLALADGGLAGVVLAGAFAGAGSTASGAGGHHQCLESLRRQPAGADG